MKIKKLSAIFLVMSLLFALFAPTASASLRLAEETETSLSDTSKPSSDTTEENDEVYVSTKRTGVTYSCFYDSKHKQILVDGAVTHDIYVAHRDYTIKLYKIGINSSFNKVLFEEAPIATTAMSIKFNFAVNVKNVMDVLSQYVVVLVSKNGTADYAGAELFPYVESEYKLNSDRNFYKGIEIEAHALSLQGEPSTAVIPVKLNKLISMGSTGHLYSFEGTNVFFDKQYIDTLDRHVRNLSSLGARIYLRLVFEDESASGETKYYIPDLNSIKEIKKLYMYCDFLSVRYSSYEYGYISGMIIGNSLDDTYLNDYRGAEEVGDYARLLAHYGLIAGVATRNNIPSADIAYSFSDINSYSGTKAADPLGPSVMIEYLCGFFDEYYSDDFDFSIVLESMQMPLGISDASLRSGIDLSYRSDGEHVTEENADIFSDYLEHLDHKYESSPKSFMYVWHASEKIGANALSCAYSYLYYKMFNADKLTAFIVSFEEDGDRIYGLSNIIENIDTQNGWYITSPLLEYFGKTAWNEVISGYKRNDYVVRIHKSIPLLEELPKGVKGSFTYFDFQGNADKSGWFTGSGCERIDINYSDVRGRTLCASIDPNYLKETEYAHLFYSYEYCENYVYTPYMSFEISIECEEPYAELFEVRITFASSNNVFEASETVYAGEISSISVDVSSLSDYLYMADVIQVSVRPMGECNGGYKLYMSSIKGYSSEYEDEELEKLISAERMRIRDLSEDNANDRNATVTFLWMIAVVIVALLLAIMLFFLLRRDDDEEDGEEKITKENIQ